MGKNTNLRLNMTVFVLLGLTIFMFYRSQPSEDVKTGMIGKAKRDALFKDIHGAIEETAESVVSQLHNASLSYPPGAELTPEEKEALSNLQLSPQAKSGLRKLVADACVTPLSHFFSLLDGVADPKTDFNKVWLGAIIAEKPEGDQPMLHDEFFETYWLCRKTSK